MNIMRLWEKKKERREGTQLMNGKVKEAAESLTCQDLGVSNRNKIRPYKINTCLRSPFQSE